jgi:hypothetical protein
MTSDNELLIELAGKYHDECLSPEEMSRLEALLTNESMRRLFIEISNVHYSLGVGTLSEQDRSLALKLSAVHDAIIPSIPQRRGASTKVVQPDAASRLSAAYALGQGLLSPAESLGQKSRSKWTRRRVAAAVISAAALILLGLFMLPQRGGVEVAQSQTEDGADVDSIADNGKIAGEFEKSAVKDSTGFVARVLAATKDVTWTSDGAPTDFLMRLEAGSRVKLATGFIKLEFSGGAELILHAPADFQALGPDAGRLFSGKLTGRSDAGSFSLFTPAAKVIDVGTEFGVSVDEDHNTGVSVFDGEVHVRPMQRDESDDSILRMTQGMSALVDRRGFIQSDLEVDATHFRRLLPHAEQTTLGASEMSLIDVISGSGVGEYRLAGSIDPATGFWGQPPWQEPKGVEPRVSRGEFVSVEWNPLLDGVFVPAAEAGPIQIDSSGHTTTLGPTCGATWGPIWARRRLDDSLDPLAGVRNQEEQGFWGVGTLAALMERLRWSRDGLVGIHPNVGVTIDLDEIKAQRGRSVRRMRGIIAHLEKSHESSPLYPGVRADFRVYVDGEIRYERIGFRRSDGDSQFGVDFDDDDRFLTLVTTDNDASNAFDHVILIDPILELADP